MIYLPFASTEYKGLAWLIFNESQDKIKSPSHIFEQFSIVFCEFLGLLCINFASPRDKVLYVAFLTGMVQ